MESSTWSISVYVQCKASSAVALFIALKCQKQCVFSRFWSDGLFVQSPESVQKKTALIAQEYIESGHFSF